jgi:diketogulonate reductase-like aldo/keto reductase
VHNLLDLDTHLKTLRAWKDEGRVRYIGITHYTVGAQSDLAKVIEREKLDFVQLNYSATTPNAEQRLLPLAADKGVAVLVNRPFEDGSMFNAVRGKPLPAWASEIDATSWGQIFLKYVLAHPAVTAAIPATGKVHHLEDNLAGARGRLPDAKLKAEIVRVLTT